MTATKETQRILMIGGSTPLVEGVYDLLQVVGYPVELSPSWVGIEYTMSNSPPSLVIVDLSSTTLNIDQVAEQIHNIPFWSHVPILFISFSGDDQIWEMQQFARRNGDGRLHFYAHTLLGLDELLDKIDMCLS